MIREKITLELQIGRQRWRWRWRWLCHSTWLNKSCVFGRNNKQQEFDLESVGERQGPGGRMLEDSSSISSNSNNKTNKLKHL